MGAITFRKAAAWIFILLGVAQSLGARANFEVGVDHAPSTGTQFGFTDAFIRDKLKDTEGLFSVKKTNELIQQLKLEKETLIRESYETKLFESLHVVMTKPSKVVKKARKWMKKKNRYLKSYRLFLVPTLKQIKTLIQEGAPTSEIEGLAQDFVRHYASYYFPNTARSVLNEDVNYLKAIKHLRGYRVPRKTAGRPWPINLRVSVADARPLSLLLGKSLRAGEYLSAQQAEILNEKGWDLSLLDPGVSSYWQRPPATAEERQKLREAEFEKLFPQEGERIQFKNIRITGMGSSKINAFFVRDGKSIEVRLKFGHEVHASIALTKLRKLLGYFQGVRTFRSRTRIWLGKTTYEAFVAQFTFKYGEERAINVIAAHGKESGEDWVEVRNTSMTLNPSNQIRLGSYQFSSFDNRDRREFRGDLLVSAWMSISDARMNNYRTFLVPDPVHEGRYIPMASFVDVGNAMGRNNVIRGPSDIFMEFNINGVNRFRPHMLQLHPKSVEIFWNDTGTITDAYFERANFEDLKWAARLIAQLSEEEIEWSLKSSGMPDDVALMYGMKLLSRRNDLVKAFGLEGEFSLFDIPEVEHFTKLPNIKNGLIVKEFYPGTTEVQPDRMNLWTLLSMFVNVAPSFRIENFNVKTNLTNLSGVTAMVYPEQHLRVAPGIGLILGRSILINGSSFNSVEGGHSYTVIDSLGFQVGISSPRLNMLQSSMNFFAGGEIRALRKEIQFVHYASTMKEAALGPFKPIGFVKNYLRYAALEMKAAESIQIQDSFGISGQAGVSAFEFSPVFQDRLSTGLSWTHTSPVTLYRNQFSELNVYIESSTRKMARLGIDALDVTPLITDLPALGAEVAVRGLKQKAELYTFKLDHADVDEGPLELTEKKRSLELEGLKAILAPGGTRSSEALKRHRVSLSAEKTDWMKRLDFLFLVKRHLTRSVGVTKIDLHQEGFSETFYRYASEKMTSKGVLLPDLVKYAATHDVQYYTNQIECAGNQFSDMVLTAKGIRYFGKLSVEQLIGEMERYNSRFSESPDQPSLVYRHLPSQAEKPEYPKVSFESLAFIKGTGLIHMVENPKTRALIEQQALSYFEKGFQGEHELPGLAPNRSIAPSLIHFRATLRSKKLLGRYTALVVAWKNVKQTPARFFLALGKFADTLNVPRFGVGLLKALVPQDSLFVQGQVYGIYRNFSASQYSEWLARRRFMARSWGVYEMDPPIRRFLFEHDKFLPFKALVRSDIYEQELLGKRPDGMAIWN